MEQKRLTYEKFPNVCTGTNLHFFRVFCEVLYKFVFLWKKNLQPWCVSVLVGKFQVWRQGRFSKNFCIFFQKKLVVNCWEKGFERWVWFFWGNTVIICEKTSPNHGNWTNIENRNFQSLTLFTKTFCKQSMHEFCFESYRLQYKVQNLYAFYFCLNSLYLLFSKMSTVIS